MWSTRIGRIGLYPIHGEGNNKCDTLIDFQIHTIFSTSMGAQIPRLPENPLVSCGCKKFKVDSLGDHLSTCTTHSGAKKDWTVGQLADLFRTTHTAKTQQVVRIRGHHCGDVELVGYLENATGPVQLVLDLRISHDRFGSSSDPILNGQLHYPIHILDMDKSLNEDAADKIRKYRTDYNNNPPNAISFMPAITSTSDRLHSEFIRLLFL